MGILESACVPVRAHLEDGDADPSPSTHLEAGDGGRRVEGVVRAGGQHGDGRVLVGVVAVCSRDGGCTDEGWGAGASKRRSSLPVPKQLEARMSMRPL